MEWNRVLYKNPDKQDIYLCATISADSKGGFERDVQVLYYSGKSWYVDEQFIITHWMEIPELPEEVF